MREVQVDENIPVEAASLFQGHGLDANTVSDESLSGADDETIANRLLAETRILITLDMDFSNIRAYPPDEYAGIVVLRLRTQDKRTVLSYLRRLARALEERDPEGELWIVQHDRIRFRKGTSSRD